MRPKILSYTPVINGLLENSCEKQLEILVKLRLDQLRQLFTILCSCCHNFPITCSFYTVGTKNS